MSNLLLLTADLWEVGDSQVREVLLSCLDQQFSYQGLLLLLGPTHVVGGGPSLIQHRPVVLKVEGVDPIHRFVGPGLVLDPIPLAFPLQGFIPFPASKPPGACSFLGLLGEVTLPIRMEVVVLVLLLLCPCLALILMPAVEVRFSVAAPVHSRLICLGAWVAMEGFQQQNAISLRGRSGEKY